MGLDVCVAVWPTHSPGFQPHKQAAGKRTLRAMKDDSRRNYPSLLAMSEGMKAGVNAGVSLPQGLFSDKMVLRYPGVKM